ncbi:MAG: polysaccharide biosynthesis tyrosine autokinase [Erysipelotrichaceae bacterium]|nr:polysaccharide biosynthesis tyrosine autokinase [Erysipelotrichaceae bacterium]
MAESKNEIEKLDITAFVDAFLNSLRKMWIVVLVLPLLLGALSYFSTRDSYVPAYKAEATVAVYSSEDENNTDSRSAQQLGTVFPYILTSGVLKDVIMEDMNVTSLPGNIKVTNVEGTNLLTISVSSTDPELSYNTLLSIIKNYPKVAEYVVGYTNIEIVDDSGIPTDSGKTVAVRGNAMKGALYGFVLSLVLVFIHMLMYKTVRTVKDVKAFSTVDHLGTLPVYKIKKRKDTSSSINILEHNVQQDYLEAMRLIRTRVLRKLESSGHKVLMVTSSVPGEGKSTIAANLAISLSGKNKTVVLVDCDLRNPSLQEIFNVSGEQPGFMDVFNGKVSLIDAIVPYENNGIRLNVLFGSPEKATSHSEVLGSPKTGEIIEKLKSIADIVILDTPPSAMLVDAMLLSKYVDEAIYVIMSDYARTGVIAEGLRELKNTGIEISGFVLNGSRETSGAYGYHNYGYGSRYYGYQENDTETESEEEKKETVTETEAQPVAAHRHGKRSETVQEKSQPVIGRRQKRNETPAEAKTTEEKAVLGRRHRRSYVGKHGKTSDKS